MTPPLSRDSAPATRSLWLSYLAIVPLGGEPPLYECHSLVGTDLYRDGEQIGTLVHYAIGVGGVEVFYRPLPTEAGS